MLSSYWWHITPYSVAHYPLYCGALHIIYVGLGLIVGLLVVIVHHYLLNIERIYSHFSYHIILSCLVHCVRRFLHWRGLIFISTIHLLIVDYSLILYFFSFYAISGIWLHNIGIRALSSGLASAKWVIMEISLQFFFLWGIRDRG